MIVAIFIILLAIGVPIAFVLGISSVFYIWLERMSTVLVAQRFFVGVDNFLILAVPLFILAGKLMNESGITDRLIDFFAILMGHIRGGLAYINIVASVFFAGITGTGAADTAAIGSILIPAMRKEGYSAEYAGAVTAVSSIIGPTIPPSVAMVVYGASAGVSVAKLFLGGIIPGLLLAAGQLLVAWWDARRREIPVRENRLTLRNASRGLLDASLAMLMPIILIGGIVLGIFTPTEAAAVAVLYALIVGFFVYRRLTLRLLFRQLYETALLTGTILVILGFAHLFGWILAAEDVPGDVARAITGLTTNPLLILLLINLLLLIVGTFMETLAAVVLLTPILLPLALSIGVDPIHFGVMMVVNLNIGLVTPPVGVCLIVAAPLAGTSIERIARAALPFILFCVAVLLLITYVPDLVMFIPNLLLE